MNEKIRVTIDPLGRPKIEGIGFTGHACFDKMKPIEDALSGGAGVDITTKPEANMIADEAEQGQEQYL